MHRGPPANDEPLIEQTEREVDESSEAEKRDLVAQIRASVLAADNHLGVDDEAVLDRFIRGELNARELADHFGGKV